MTKKASAGKNPKVSVAAEVRQALAQDRKLRKARDSAQTKGTKDSFVNYQQMLGIGADNALTTATYAFNPITRQRTLLEWMHRGNWLCGIAVDAKAEDMAREGVSLEGELEPEEAEKLEQSATSLKVWDAFKRGLQWGRLYGGSIGVHMIDGQDPSTPLNVDRIGKGAYKGIAIFDRWAVDPTLNDLVTDMGPDLGLPKFYRINPGAQAMPGAKIHHSRVIRFIGITLPYQQFIMENMWGISVLERVYDRLVAYDSTTTGAAQLVYKAWVRTYKIKGLRGIITQGGKAYRGMLRMVQDMRRLQSSEGITLLDDSDSMEAMQPNSYSGLSDMMLQFAQQVSGALQIPLVRLLGQSPAGLNSSGDSDWRMYYDGIKKDQKAELFVPVQTTYRCIAISEGITLPDNFKAEFKPLYQLTDKEKAEIAETDTRTITAAEDSGLISQQRAMVELKHSGRTTGRFSSITTDEIEAAEETLPPAGEEAMGAMGGQALGVAAGLAKEGLDPDSGQPAEPKTAKDKRLAKKARDRADNVTATMKRLHDLNVAIENPRGSIRVGQGWAVKMSADYGYLSGTNGGDGEEVDCFVGPQHESQAVFVLSQVDPETGAPDEDKVLLGYPDMGAALRDYFGSYTDSYGWKRVGGVAVMPMQDFKAWVAQRAAGA